MQIEQFVLQAHMFCIQMFEESFSRNIKLIILS